MRSLAIACLALLLQTISPQVGTPAPPLGIPPDSYHPQLLESVPVPGTNPNEVYVALRDPGGSYGPPPEGCSPEEVATVMVRFFAAWSDGDTESLRSLLAPDADDEEIDRSRRPERGNLGWFGINPIPGGIADGSGAGGYTVDDVLQSAADRHEHHEVIQVLQIKYGSTWHDRGIGMTFDLARDADDIPPHIVGGKGGIDCPTGRITVVSASDQSPVVPDRLFGGVEPIVVPEL